MRWTRRVRRLDSAPNSDPRAPEIPDVPEGDRPMETDLDFVTSAPPLVHGQVITGGMTQPASPRSPRYRRTLWRVTGIALGGAVLGAAAMYFGVPAYRAAAAAYAQIHTVAVSPAQEAVDSPAVAVYKNLSPSVVLVRNESSVSGFYGTQNQIAWGSGVIFNSSGYIVTNDHVVAGATKVTVTLKDGSSYPATVVGGDPSTDLAVIRINAGRLLPAATFANSNDVVPGELAIAIGNPLGPQFQQSVTTGVVGAVRPMLYGLNMSTERVTEMIQINAAINPGNSGGALANAQGEVIGITSMKVAQTGEPGVSATGLGFAIPSNTVEQVVNDIVRYGYVQRAWLGIDLQSNGGMSTTAPETLTVASVLADGPSAGKLQPGDIIRSWNGRQVTNYYDLVGDINAAKPGQTVALGILRGSTAETVHITLGTEPRSIADGSAAAAPQTQPSPVQIFPFPIG